MAFRLYLVPAIGTGSPTDSRRPKYFDGLAFNATRNQMDFGFQPVFLVCCDLINQADHDSIAAQADAFVFPVDLSPQMGGAAAATANILETRYFIPANWLTGSLTWLETTRAICGMFQYMQRLNGVIGNVVVFDGTGNKTLNTQFNQIDPAVQTAITQAAQSLGYSTAFIAGNTQVRAILKNFADQWGNKPFIFGTFVI